MATSGQLIGRAGLIQALALMRYLIAILVLGCAACQPPQEVVPPHEVLPPQSPPVRSEAPNPLDTNQRVHVFGGTVVGFDMGEFGGEVSFIEPDGTTYQVIADNSHGIFNTPHGVIAITGLAHMSINRGTVFLISRQPGERVVATATLQLPGAPCKDMKLSDGSISLRVFTDIGDNDPNYRCFSLRSPSDLVEQQCAPGPQSFQACFAER